MSQDATSGRALHTAASELFALIEAGHLREAESIAARRAGSNRDTAAQVAWTLSLSRQGRRAEALRVARAAAQESSGDPVIDDVLGVLLSTLGDHSAARAVCERALKRHSADARLWFNLASIARAQGDIDAAEDACNRVIALTPEDYPVYLLRADLRRQSPQTNHVANLAKLLASGALSERGRMFLGYALGKELDDLGHFEEAFRWFTEGSRQRRRRLKYDVNRDLGKLRRIAEVFDRERLNNIPADRRSRRFAFIVGLPRSGTTLLERIASTHTAVASNEETQNFAMALFESCARTKRSPSRPPSEDIFEQAASADTNAVATRYIELADQRAEATLILEKLPMNYLYVGAIHMALPSSPIIATRRDPLDSCFAMYRTLFGGAYPFSYTFEELAAYYGAYERLMRHWRDVLPGRMLEIPYESIVSAPAVWGEAMMAHCGLEWHPDQLNFHRSSAAATTASAVQVRRPLYTSSVGHWRNYANQLEPLIDALRREGVVMTI